MSAFYLQEKQTLQSPDEEKALFPPSPPTHGRLGSPVCNEKPILCVFSRPWGTFSAV